MKKLLTKSLLVAICLLGGVNFVWGAPTSYLTTWTGLVGTDNTADLYYGTKKVRIAAGETYVFTIKNFNDGGADTWHNWVVEGNSGDKFFDCCANGDNWPYGTGASTPSYTPVIATTDVADFMTKYNGATVTITISRNATGDQITVVHTSDVLGTTDGNTDKYYGGTYTIAVGAAEEWDVYLTQRYSHFVVTNVVYTESDGTTTHSHTPAIEALPFSRTWDTQTTAYPFNVGGVTTGANSGVYAWTKKTTNNTTAYINFDSNPWTDGLQAYELSQDETITASFTAYEGWLSNGSTATVKLLNSEGISLAEYTYNSGSCQVTNVSFNGTTATNYTSFSGQSRNNGNATKNTADGFSTASKNYVTTSNYNPTVTFTVSDNGYVTFSFVSSLAGSKSYNTTLPTSGDGAVKMDIASICVIDNISNSDRALGINNLNITSAVAAKHTVTFTYADTDNNSLSSIKGNSSVQATEGTSVASLISETLTESFYNGDASIRYDYTDNYTITGNATTVPDNDITVTLKFAPKGKCSYSANAVDGENAIIQSDIISGTCYVEDSPIFYIPACVLVDKKLYFTTEEAYYKSEAVNSDQVFPYAYTTSIVDNVVFFVEGENLSGASISTPNNNQQLASRGNMGRGSNLSITTLPAGKYTIYVHYINTNSGGHNILVKAGTETIMNETGVTVRPTKDAIFTLSESAELTITAEGSSTSGIDYIYIVQAGIPATIGANGYTTFASPYCLDLANLPEGLKAYTATLDGKELSFAECTQAVPVGTGLLLAGTGGETYNIPVTTTGTAVSGNALTGVTATTDLKSDETNYIFAMKKAGQATDPLTFAPLAPTNVAFPAGKAYITVPVSAFNDGARALTISFEEATGIASMPNTQCTMHNDVYNLQGQRISSPKKGLYIVNGAKVVIK